jgi:hypothetical protein
MRSHSHILSHKVVLLQLLINIYTLSIARSINLICQCPASSQGGAAIKKMDFDEEDDFFTMENLCLLQAEESKILLETGDIKTEASLISNSLKNAAPLDRSVYVFQGENKILRANLEKVFVVIIFGKGDFQFFVA